jgi:hypothetical protein
MPRPTEGDTKKGKPMALCNEDKLYRHVAGGERRSEMNTVGISGVYPDFGPFDEVPASAGSSSDFVLRPYFTLDLPTIDVGKRLHQLRPAPHLLRLSRQVENVNHAVPTAAKTAISAITCFTPIAA